MGLAGIVDLVLDSVLLFGRLPLGAGIGLLIGWVSQRRRHSRWVVGWTFLGYAAGAATMWPDRLEIGAAALLIIPGLFGMFIGWVIGASTLKDREDWYLRALGFAGFAVGVQAAAVGAMAAVDALD